MMKSRSRHCTYSDASNSLQDEEMLSTPTTTTRRGGRRSKIDSSSHRKERNQLKPRKFTAKRSLNLNSNQFRLRSNPPHREVGKHLMKRKPPTSRSLAVSSGKRLIKLRGLLLFVVLSLHMRAQTSSKVKFCARIR